MEDKKIERNRRRGGVLCVYKAKRETGHEEKAKGQGKKTRTD